MSSANKNNTILVHACKVIAIDDMTLSIKIPGGHLTLNFESRNAMHQAAKVIILATKLPVPASIEVDELAVGFKGVGISKPEPRIPEGKGKEAPKNLEDLYKPLPYYPESGESECDESEKPKKDDDSEDTESLGDVGLTQELAF